MGSITMKMLITGGNRGLGKHLVDVFGADSVSRATNLDITNEQAVKLIAQQSLNYDVFVNNAFDGPPQEAWANFAQTNLYMAVYDKWKDAGKSGHIFNIGSVGEKHVVAAEPRFETYRVAKTALAHASRQGTQSFKQNLVQFRTTLITPDRLDTELSRSRPTWTGNGIALTDISNFIRYATTVSPNTVVEEATFYVNFEHKA
jgi:NAD(P)-dependent dehydrogenase (short-subunit alcohol dehydrogenase family)